MLVWLVELFVPDVQVGRNEFGRPALRKWFVNSLSRFQSSVHFVANHIIDIDDPDHAHGVIYCRDELEREHDWRYGYIQYWDRYERRDGLWYFVRRKFYRWFMVDTETRPTHGAGVGDDDESLTTGQLPEAWPSWERFWRDDVGGAR